MVAIEIQYKTNEFVMDAYNIRITTKKLNKYQQAYHQFQEQERRRIMLESEANEKIRTNNYHLSNRVKNLEGSLQQLNREHVELANELVMNKVEVDRLNDENAELRSTISSLRKNLNEKPEEVEQI